MNDQLAVDAAAEVTTARAKVDELLKIEAVLLKELPIARSALQLAERKLRDATRPSKAATRKHELDLLKKRLEEARHETA
jgi:hypothetical protein